MSRSMRRGYPDLRAELLAFPSGKFDDQVDALGLVGQLLDKMTVGQKLKVKDERPRIDGYERARQLMEQDPPSWKLM